MSYIEASTNLAKVAFLKAILNRYFELPEASWQAYLSCCTIRELKKRDILYSLGEIPTSFAFLNKGLMRAYVIDDKGNEFNKNFFAKGRFPGSMTALLNQTPSKLAVEALEACEIIEINFKRFRKLLFTDPAMMRLHIHYLETHWLLEKEPKEIGYLQDEAKHRYLAFLDDYGDIAPRLSQYHIAGYLGITPTQLSRLKKQI